MDRMYLAVPSLCCSSDIKSKRPFFQACGSPVNFQIRGAHHEKSISRAFWESAVKRFSKIPDPSAKKASEPPTLWGHLISWEVKLEDMDKAAADALSVSPGTSPGAGKERMASIRTEDR